MQQDRLGSQARQIWIGDACFSISAQDLKPSNKWLHQLAATVCS